MISVFTDYPCVQAGFCNAEESHHLERPILMTQVHSAEPLLITKAPTESPKCDALVTQVTHLKLTIKTADCAPVLFLDPKAKIIAATHAGWKGAFQGVLENTLLTMLRLGATLTNIHVAIGPHLTQQNFQVSKDMQNLFPATEQHFFKTQEQGTYFDFSGYLSSRLHRAGIQKIERFDIDTFTDLTYNSYRRDKENPDRQYSFIELTKGV